MIGQATTDMNRLSELRDQLAAVATELGAEGLSPERVEQLVARCAELATSVSAELDRLAGAERDQTLPGQQELL